MEKCFLCFLIEMRQQFLAYGVQVILWKLQRQRLPILFTIRMEKKFVSLVLELAHDNVASAQAQVTLPSLFKNLNGIVTLNHTNIDMFMNKELVSVVVVVVE